MSSLNPVFLLPEAMATRGDAIAQGLCASFTMGVGQFCTKPGLVFALRGADTDRFIATLSKQVEAAPAGTMLSGDIRKSFEANRASVMAAAGVAPLASASAVADTARTQASATVGITDAKAFLRTPELATEAFGPFALVILADDMAQMQACARALEGQLTATLHGTDADLLAAAALVDAAEQCAGRLIVNSFPTGVEVCAAMNHGGPYPATSDVRFTSVGTAAMLRFARPVCYQGFPGALLPPELQDANPLGIQRLLDNQLTRAAI
jgi:NADP-dependent aldehyde dehydrogenase